MRKYLMQVLLSLIISFGTVSGPSTAEAKTNYINTATYKIEKQQTVITILFSKKTNYTFNELNNPDRIYFDIKNNEIDNEILLLVKKINATTGLIEKATVAKNRKNIVRIVFQLSQGVKTKVSGDSQSLSLIASQDAIPDLIDNFYQAESTQTKNKIWEKEQYVIAIDAGHGGKDPGAVGRKGTTEKSINLSIAKKLKIYIDKEPNMRAVLTRDKDVYVKLADRIRKIRKHQPTIFISIHADGAKNRKASGSSVFILPRKDEVASSRYAKLVAAKENEMDLLFDPDIDERDKDTQKTILDLSQNVTRYLSEQLGSSVLKQMGKVNNLHKKKVEKANFAVLKSIDVCSILVETAFLSNSKEERQLKTSEYQNRIALAIL
ncbi:MAG: N-acetylmuramoyl-L-alanine amidase, partial [Burkholderiales bacterium]|nr:N-acetylmuramoyl-L-alanine amidase [Burkholderiales bacterium]